MKSENAKVKSEKSPLEGSGCCSVSGDRRGVLSPFEGGMRLRVQRKLRGDDSMNVDENTPPKTNESPLPIIPLVRQVADFPPSKGETPNPLLRGESRRSVQHSLQGCVDEVPNSDHTHFKNLIPTIHTPQSPLKRGGLVPKLYCSLTALIIILFLSTAPVFGQASGNQLETNSLDTPQIESGTSDSIVSSYPQLEEYLRIAVDENPELRSLNYLYRAEMERSREVGVLPDPELNINYDFNPMMSESQLGRFSVSAMQMFPWFGSLSTMRKAQRSAAEADRAQIDVRELEILRDLQITWFDIAEVQEQIRITKQNIELVRELIPLVEIRYETGGAGQADILRIQMEEQRLQNRIRNLTDQLNPLKAEFNEFLNRDPDAQVETADSLQSQTIQFSDEQIRELVTTQNPAFEALSARESSLAQQERAAQLDGRPSFGLGLEVMGRDFGPMSMFPDATESFIGMATIRLPIFRSRTQSQRQQITERLNALEFDRHQTENRLTAEVERVLEEIRKSERNIRLLEEELVPRAQQAFTILSEAYSVGTAQFDELLQIQRELLELEIERIDALAGQNRAVVRLESLVGNSSPPLTMSDYRRKGERSDEGGSGG